MQLPCVPDAARRFDDGPTHLRGVGYVLQGVSYEISSGALMQITICYRSRFFAHRCEPVFNPIAGLGEATTTYLLSRLPF